MARAMRTAQHIGQPRDRHRGGKAFRIDLVDIGHIDRINPKARQFGRVILFGAGIVFQIVRIVELFRVHKDRHDHPVTGLFRRRHKAEMPVMQRTHGRNDAHNLACHFPGTGVFLKRGFAAQNRRQGHFLS